MSLPASSITAAGLGHDSAPGRALAASGRVSAAVLPHLLRWWCEQLVRALLDGAWHFVARAEGAALDRAFARFSALVNAAPCWPCRVSWVHPREMAARADAGLPCWQCLCITTGAAADYDLQEEFV